MITFKDKQKTLHKRIKQLRLKATLAELHVKNLLDRLNVNYIFQKSFIEGRAYVIVDFYLPKPYKVCLEVDGKYHDRQKDKDNWKDEYLKGRGFKVVRITNEEAFLCKDLSWILSIA